MPELPEVESVARSIINARPPLLGSRVVSVDAVWAGVVAGTSPDIFSATLCGRILQGVSRHGKYLFFELISDGHAISVALHLRMTGIVHICAADTAPGRHTRLIIGFDNGRALRFDDPRKFGRVWLVDTPADAIAGLGPDALSVGWEEFRQRLRGSRRQLKTLLLDQSFLAGIGNIYADESLFLAGLHPLRRSESLDDNDVARLYQAVKTVLDEAVGSGGANIDGVFKAGGYLVRVYGREGLPCLKCGSRIEKIRVGQRGTHYCPDCQLA